MRIRITHNTVYKYSGPIKSAIQVLRLTPRNHDGQFIANWAIDVEGDARLVRSEDWFGNVMHGLTLEGPASEVVVRARGEVETEDSLGVIRGTVERFPPELFLRETGLTGSDPAIVDFAQTAAASAENSLARMHALMHAIFETMTFDATATDVVTTAAQALSARHGVCQDLTHVFLSSARSMGVPARYVSGYLHRPGETEQEATHAWAEAYVEDLGWVGFDPTNAVCVTEGYVRLATGLDYLDAAPVKGSYYGAAQEHMHVQLTIDGTAQPSRSDR